MRLWRPASLYTPPLNVRNQAAAAAVVAVALPPLPQLRLLRPIKSALRSSRPGQGSCPQCRSHSTGSSSSSSAVIVHSGLLSTSSFAANVSREKMNYIRGWAWQTVLLQQRLREKRHTESQRLPHVILVLEHEPIYTLGRGATVDHVTCLALSQSNDVNCQTVTAAEAARLRLDRSYRQADAARLSIESTVMEPFLTASLSGSQLLSRNPTLLYPPDNTAPKTAAVVPLRLTAPIWNAVDAVCRSVQQRHAIFPPVYTPPVIDSSAGSGDGVPVYRMERGGDVTFHGPGQLLIYPIFNLAQEPFQRCDLHWYLRRLEQAVINAVTELVESSATQCSVPTTTAPKAPVVHRIDRDADYTGVWINGKDKIAAIGVAASRWITTHGIALNVSTNLAYFDENMIVPCGIQAGSPSSGDNDSQSAPATRRGVTSLAALGVHTTMSHTAEIVLKHLSRVFAIDLIQGEPIH
jgi:lipoyl(octanoyl) transferase